MDAGLEERFKERGESFAALWDQHVAGWETAFGLRVTLLPCGSIRTDVSHLRAPPAMASRLKAPEDLNPCMSGDLPRLVIEQAVRGTEIFGNADGRYDRRLICEDGLIEYLTIDHLSQVHPAPPMAVVGNALLALDQLRRDCGQLEVEFMLMIEIRTRRNVSLIDYDLTHEGRPLGNVPAHKTFPQHTIGRKEDVGRVWTAVERNFWIACGAKPRTLIDFDSIIKSLN